MTLEQLKTEMRRAYEARDRDRHEWALSRLDTLLQPPETKPTAGDTPEQKGAPS